MKNKTKKIQSEQKDTVGQTTVLSVNPTQEFIQVGDGIDLNKNTNFHPRSPTAFILDTSGSMNGEPIQELNKALPGLFKELLANDLTSLRVEPSIITCGGDVKVMLPFGPLESVESCTVTLTANGETPLGTAIMKAIDEIEVRKAYYRTEGLSHYVPTIVILSDGRPTDFEWKQASERLHQLSNKGKSSWTVIAVGIGPRADIESLKLITSAAMPPMRLEGLKFAELFRWLSGSIHAATNQAPVGDTTPGIVLPTTPGAVVPAS